MTTIIYRLMEANTNAEINDIVWNNIDTFNERPSLFVFVRGARRRINRLRREMRKSYRNQLN